MHSSYEKRQFQKQYFFCALLSLLVTFWVTSFVCCLSAGVIAVIMTTVLLVLLFLYFIIFRFIRNIFDEIDTVSDIMLDVVDGKDNYEKEKYQQGSIGILYTNFYKMVSALKESQLKAQEEKEFLRDIISDISHQLKTPLASLNVFMDLLYDDKVTNHEEQKKILKEAQNQLSRMEWMVLSMLKLARIEAGAIQFDVKPTGLFEVVTMAMEQIRYLTDKRNQILKLDWNGEMSETYHEKKALLEKKEDVILCCDGEWLTEALVNLLKNASDYSGEHTAVTVKVEDSRMYTRIYVKDEGMGIPEDALPHIFKRFYRVDHEVNPNSVGIGLSLVKSIVEGMHGRITVKSIEKEYTCFILTFVKY